MANDNLILVSGTSTTGKSFCLKGLRDPKGVMYLNTESNKKLPFKSDFDEYNITDPYQIYEAFTAAEGMDNIHTIVVDSLTYMMQQFETLHVLTSSNTMKAWGEYAQFFNRLMLQYVANSSKNVIFTGHSLSVHDEIAMTNDVMVKVKGSLMNNGIESYFSTVVSTKKKTVKELDLFTEDKGETPLRVVTDDQRELTVKNVFQTRLTAQTVNERLRSPDDMWAPSETYIDNNIQHVLDRLVKFYK